MSKDTIYREDAIKAINARSNWYQVTCNGKQIAVMLMAKDVNETLEKVPSADRPQGEWTQNVFRSDIYRYECSNCKAHHRARYDYCPSCGARMKGADDENNH